MDGDTHTPDSPPAGADAPEPAPLAAVETDGGDLLVYDEDEEAAWLQSDVYCSLERED